MNGLALLATLVATGCGGDSLAAPVLQEGEVAYDFTSPKMYIEGEPFKVTITAVAPVEGMSSVPVWALTPSAFELEGAALGERQVEQFVPMVPGQRLQTTVDLGPAIERTEAFQDRNFRLSFGPDEHTEEVTVTYLQAAEKGIDFMSLPLQQLGDYDVVLQTIQGPVWLTIWSDIAPNHAPNCLDLAYTGV